jgi:hypothetical protein
MRTFAWLIVAAVCLYSAGPAAAQCPYGTAALCLKPALVSYPASASPQSNSPLLHDGTTLADVVCASGDGKKTCKCKSSRENSQFDCKCTE